MLTLRRAPVPANVAKVLSGAPLVTDFARNRRKPRGRRGLPRRTSKGTDVRNPIHTKGQTMTAEYVASPRTEDPADLLRESDIAIRSLLQQLEDTEALLVEREAYIGELLRELAGVHTGDPGKTTPALDRWCLHGPHRLQYGRAD